jgi:UDP-N-acetylmuramyl pentapeptide synthase
VGFFAHLWQYRSWEGRQREYWYLNDVLWPWAARIAWLYRRTVARRVRVVVVIGSLGKTTTRRMLGAVLGADRPERFNTRAVVGLWVLGLRPWCRLAVIEVGLGRKGEMIEYARVLRPDVVVATSVASDHNTSFGTLTVTREEKVIMVRALRADGLLIVNGDDPHTRWMATQTRAGVITYGLDASNAVQASGVRMDWPRGTRFRARIGSESLEVCTRFFGRAMVYPALAALAGAQALGVAPADALQRLAAVAPADSRLEPVVLASGAVMLCDEYKSGVETVDAALDVLAEIPARRRWVVMGDLTEPPGSQSEQRAAYVRAGERIGRIAQRAIFMRGHATLYRQGARRGGMDPRNMAVAEDVAAATALLRPELADGDVVLVKGRWMQRLDRITLALSGREVNCRRLQCGLKLLACARCPLLGVAQGGSVQPAADRVA